MRRLLFVSHRLPYPPDKGERVRAFHEIRTLSRWFHVTVVAPAPPGGDGPDLPDLPNVRWVPVPDGRIPPFLRAGTRLLCGGAASQGHFDSPRLRRELQAAAVDGVFDVAVAYCSSMVPAVLSAPARARVADVVDADSAKWAAYAEDAGPLRGWLYRREAAAVAELEARAAGEGDAVACVSEAELAAMGLSPGPRALAIGNGVDTDYFYAPLPDESEPGRIVFTGTMDYRPNLDAVCWFAREVLPGIRAAVSEASFTIVGRDPAPAVRQLAARPGVVVTGSVPDVRPYLARAAVAVCPLRLARGVQNKVLEAMAMARPVVASPAALEGLDADPGRHVLQADSAREFGEAVVGLLTDSALRARMGDDARGHVERRYNWDARLAPLVDLCRRLAGCHEEPGAAARRPTAAEVVGEEAGGS